MARRTRKAQTKQGALDLRAPLECCPHKQLNRQVGVLVTEPFHHAGMDQEMVDVIYEYPELNSATYGSPKPTAEATQVAANRLKHCIDECAKIKDEMTNHIARMLDELANLGAD